MKTRSEVIRDRVAHAVDAGNMAAIHQFDLRQFEENVDAAARRPGPTWLSTYFVETIVSASPLDVVVARMQREETSAFTVHVHPRDGFDTVLQVQVYLDERGGAIAFRAESLPEMPQVEGVDLNYGEDRDGPMVTMDFAYSTEGLSSMERSVAAVVAATQLA